MNWQKTSRLALQICFKMLEMQQQLITTIFLFWKEQERLRLTSFLFLLIQLAKVSEAIADILKVSKELADDPGSQQLLQRLSEAKAQFAAAQEGLNAACMLLPKGMSF